jgi:hypothetical protein|tara:strand:+ start:11520 stop:11972 length:453 start_codon:yes stop_codon:yes gene_type:complete
MSCESCDIKNLLYQYADYLDSGDIASVAQMFAHAKMIGVSPDGTETVTEGAAAVEAIYQSFTRVYEDNGTPHTQHVTTNAIVKVDEAGLEASCKSYAVVFQSVDDFPMQPIIGVRYYDRFEKADGQWRFSERKIDSRLFGDLSRHLLRGM